MQNAASLLIVASTLLPIMAVAATGHVKIHNDCDFPVWVNDVAPSVGKYDAWSQIAPHDWFTAAHSPIAGEAGTTQKIGLQRGTTDILQLEVGMNPTAGGTFHYDMSTIDGNPFNHVGKRLGCHPDWPQYDFQYCAPYETKFPCGKQVPGSFQVMSAPSDCGDIVLELCFDGGRP